MIATPQEVLNFWFVECEPADWFKKSEEFDNEIRSRFLETYEAIVIGGSDESETPAEIILSYGIDIDVELKSAVAEGTDIGEYCREKVRWNRNIVIAQQV